MVKILKLSNDGGLLVENTRGSIGGVLVWPLAAPFGTEVPFSVMPMTLGENWMHCGDEDELS